MELRVLIACEFSGIVRDAFTKLGHDATSCDLLPSETPGKHYQGDVMDIINDGWDLMIAHPPCTYLCNSGVRWLKGNPQRFKMMLEAAQFFITLLSWHEYIPKVCLENPIPHKHAKLPAYDQIIQPYQFGHGEKKATCLWLKGLPKLQSFECVDLFNDTVTHVSGREQKVHRMPPGKDRWKDRSRTYSGIAEAMANQWTEKLTA